MSPCKRQQVVVWVVKSFFLYHKPAVWHAFPFNQIRVRQMFRFSSLDNIWCFYQLFNYIVVCLKRPKANKQQPGRLKTLIALMCIETRYQFSVFGTQRLYVADDYASDVRTWNISIFPALIIKSHSVWCKIHFPWKSTWLFSVLNTVLRKPPRFHSPEAYFVSGWMFNDHNFYAVLSRAIKFPLNGIPFKLCAHW